MALPIRNGYHLLIEARPSKGIPHGGVVERTDPVIRKDKDPVTCEALLQNLTDLAQDPGFYLNGIGG